LLLAAQVLAVLRIAQMARIPVTANYHTKPRSRSGRSVRPAAAVLLVEAIIQLLEAGTTPWRRQLDASGGEHHVNLLSGHRY
jgi:hypothetical protein